ncbi:MAG: phospholipid methyltransferase [Hyphomicrobiales bacterium]|nr:phospholipid methyltransferase [Hyphomicrobiales bacterium]MDE2115375.1 phospholipid methyltransferase [Hyphomicrobiales bacterium]
MAGALSPSGRYLARAMASQVNPADHGPVIELGPGTGPVTAALIARGVAEERLIMVEYDQKFCELLAHRYPKAKIIQGDAYDLVNTLAGHVNGQAAAVVSSLPLLLRPNADRLRVLADSLGLVAPNAPFVQFSYGFMSPLPRNGHATGNLQRGPDAHTAKLGHVHFESRRLPPVLRNIPPAHIWVYRQTPAAASA